MFIDLPGLPALTVFLLFVVLASKHCSLIVAFYSQTEIPPTAKLIQFIILTIQILGKINMKDLRESKNENLNHLRSLCQPFQESEQAVEGKNLFCMKVSFHHLSQHDRFSVGKKFSIQKLSQSSSLTFKISSINSVG